MRLRCASDWPRACLPDLSVGDLIEALERLAGGAIDEAALNRVTVTQLKASFGQSHDIDGDEETETDFRAKDMEAFKEAVRILWGETSEEDKLPPLEAYRDGDMPGSVRVAFASNSQEQLDGHFGSCMRYLVYQVSGTQLKLVDARPTLAADLTSDKNAFRVNLIKDCKVLYVVSAGGPAAAKVHQGGYSFDSDRRGRQRARARKPTAGGTPRSAASVARKGSRTIAFRTYQVPR